MSSPAEPKRRRLDDDVASSAGVSFVAQDVSEEKETMETDTTVAGDADGDADLHAQLKVAVERRKEAQADLDEAKERSARAKDDLERTIDDERRKLETSQGELYAKQEAARKEMHSKHSEALSKLCDEHKAERRALSMRQDAEEKELIAKQNSARRELDAKSNADRRKFNETQDAARRDLSAKHEASQSEYDRLWTPRLENVQSCFEKTRNEELLIRAGIRERGQIESDSLLVVGNDGIAAVLPFLTAPELGLCEVTCRVLKMLSQGSAHWEYLGKFQSATNRSSASDARTRVVRYYAASKLAERLEPLYDYHRAHLSATGCKICSEFPSMTLINPSPAEYELFVRCSNDDVVLIEGFVDYELYDVPRPFSSHFPSILSFNMDSFDLAKWSTMDTLFRLDEGLEHPQWREAVRESLADLIVTVVGVEKSTSKPHLVALSDNFDHEEDDDNGKTSFYSRYDLGVFPHEVERETPAGVSRCCLVFKWNDDRRSSRKFECHMVRAL